MARKPAPRTPAKRKPKEQPEPHGPKLTDDMRAFIVVQLACYRSLTTVQKQIKDRYDIEVSLPAICHYDPATRSQAALKWAPLYDDTRARFIEELQRRPLFHQAYRLDELQQTIDASKEIMLTGTEGKLDAAEQIRKAVETAAKEVGGVFTNVKKGSLELTGSIAVSTDEKRNVLEDKLKDIIEGRFTDMKPAKRIEKG